MNLNEKLNVVTVTDFMQSINLHNPVGMSLTVDNTDNAIPVSESIVNNFRANVEQATNDSWTEVINEFVTDRVETPNEARLALKAILGTDKKSTKKLREG